MKKLILYLTIIVSNTYTQPIENQPLPKIPHHTMIDNSLKDEKLKPETSPENDDSEQKDPNNFEDIIECLTNPHSACKNILFNPNDTGIYAKTHQNLRTQPRLTITKVCSDDPKVKKALKQYNLLLTNERKLSGKSMYDQTFRQYIKQKERLIDLCLTITRRTQYREKWKNPWDDETLESEYKECYALLKKNICSGKNEWRHLSQEYTPFLSDLKSIIEKKEAAEIFTTFKAGKSNIARNPHDVFDVIDCIINPHSNCNTILFSIDGDFFKSKYNVRCEAQKSIAHYMNNQMNHTNIHNGKVRLIKKASFYGGEKKVIGNLFLKIHNICKNIAASYCPSCDDKTQESFYNELNKEGIEKILENTIIIEKHVDDSYDW